eukprot:scaffold179457_cov28-Tisochrysis_lutea.AAC.4
MPLPQQPQQMPPTDGKPTSAAPTMPSSTAIADTAAAGDESRASVTGRETFTERSMRAGEIFTTKNGREVKTGGGIAPDVQVSLAPSISPGTMLLARLVGRIQEGRKPTRPSPFTAGLLERPAIATCRF